MESKIETDEPMRDIPYTDKLDPKRLKLRVDKPLPRLAKSNTLAMDPHLQMPKVDAAEPKREKDRTEIVEPIENESNTEHDDPNRATP